VQRVREIYDEAVSYVDLMIGKAVDTIESSVDPDKTLLIFTADHGDELAEHGGYGHARTLYEEVERVPLIMRGPGLEAGRVKTRVSNVNLYETIKSLVCPGDNHREALSSPLVDSQGRPTSTGNDTVFAQLGSINAAEKWRLTKVVRPDGMEAIIKDDTVGKQLESQVYSLADDPGETKKLTTDVTALAQQAARIERDVKAFASLHGVAYATTEAKWQKDFGQPQADLSDEEKKLSRQLKSLGYLH
jgi:arylsulfatase A-like enzyme